MIPGAWSAERTLAKSARPCCGGIPYEEPGVMSPTHPMVTAGTGPAGAGLDEEEAAAAAGAPAEAGFVVAAAPFAAVVAAGARPHELAPSAAQTSATEQTAESRALR